MTTQEITATTYAPETALMILQNYGVSIGLSPNTDIYVYPLAHVFPVNSLLEDTIRYFLLKGDAKTDRRVGFQMQSDAGEFFFLMLNLSEWQDEVATDIRKQLDAWIKEQGEDKGVAQDEVIKYILSLPELAEKFRHLYAKGEAVVVGMDVDEALVEKLKPLVTRAYSLEISLNFLPPENGEYRDVHVVQDALTLLRSGEVKREIPSVDVFNAHRSMCKRALQVHETNLQACEKALRNLNQYTERFDRVIKQTLQPEVPNEQVH